MNLKSLTLPVLLLASGCIVGQADLLTDSGVDTTDASTMADTTTDVSTMTDTETDGDGTADTSDDAGTSSDTETDSETTTPTIEAVDGLYELVGVEIESDPCGFLNPSYTFYTEEELLRLYLPERARLVAGSGFFNWREADSDLNTVAPIRCDYAGTSFDCETQTAQAAFTESGTLFWTYEIAVTGEVLSEEVLETRTVVEYVEADTFAAAYLAAAGVDLNACDNTLLLTWEFRE